LSSLLVAYTGDSSARTISQVQPVKFASMEALYEGKTNAGLVAFGLLKDSEKKFGKRTVKDFAVKIEIPSLLSVLTGGDKDAYVPGIKDQLEGNADRKIMAIPEKMERGKYAQDVLQRYNRARLTKDKEQIESIKGIFNDKDFQTNYFRYFGYASVLSPEDVIPNVSVAFYSFHLMVTLGFIFLLIFAMALYFLIRGEIEVKRWFLWIALLSLPLTYIASELGWILAEVGRQPWIIQDLMHVSGGVSHIKTGSVITTFVLFAVLFTGLLISEISIMLKQIKTGPRH